MGAEYVDDVPYIRQFVADLSPTRLRLAAALNGIVPPPPRDFDYCELGCAHGDTLVALAAAHPEGRFLGIDVSAAHVASAKRLVRDGALENVGILERDFSALVDEEMGELDYIVAHGVLSWISPEKRKALIAFAGAKLKPGGLLHVSYNALPGWASVEPLRQLLLFGGGQVARGGGETSLERARRGLDLAAAMRGAGAKYFVENPSASEMLETMAKAGLSYVVHEYMHEHWEPMYFARVAREMAASDLHFVGVLPIHGNFRDAALSEAHERLLAAATDRATFESLKDFAINEFFRRDVYVKGSVASEGDATKRYLDATAWGTLANPGEAARTVKLPHRTLAFGDPIYDALFAALGQGATTLSAIAGRDDLEAVGADALRAALTRLIVAELVLPMQHATTLRPTSADDRFSVPSVYNQMMLRRLGGDTPLVMASTVAGTAFPISALEGLALRALTEVAAPGRPQWVHDLVSRSVMRIRVGDQVVEEQADQCRAILDTVAQLQTRRLAKFVELGILAPSPRV